MPLPAPQLDDRRFQDIVDQAKSLIPQYCPEWTDHNVSDPGVTLIELFAWMTDLLLYRVNQVPDKMYLSFLELIGVRLDPPRAARAPVTFHLSAAQSGDVTIPEDTEVATIRTGTSPAIVFSTERSATIRVPVLTGAFTRDIERRGEGEWEEPRAAGVLGASRARRCILSRVSGRPEPPRARDHRRLSDGAWSRHRPDSTADGVGGVAGWRRTVEAVRRRVRRDGRLQLVRRDRAASAGDGAGDVP
jgi:hypothetical protein